MSTETTRKDKSHPALVIGASSLGTMFEWYDFFLYGALASEIARHFFSGVNETTSFIFALATFAAGFFVRPFGALLFGRIGDLIGRKTTFLATMVIMGASTFLVGLLPTYEAIGVAAPIMLIILRLLQGLAIGGEYGGAAIYVAEHAPAGKRGYYTSWINAMATSGLVMSLLTIMAVRMIFPAEQFSEWAWRIPYLGSALLLAVSVWIRLQLDESPVFRAMRAAGETTRAPFAETFGRWSNLRLVLIALFGCVGGSTVVWYTGQFYILFFLNRMLGVDGLTTNALVLAGLLIGAPSYVLFGWLSDRIGRKPVILCAGALALATYFPAFHALTWAANPALAHAQQAAPVIVAADTADCSLQFDPVGRTQFDERSCDIAKSYLTGNGVSYDNVRLGAGAPAEVRVGARVVVAPQPEGLSDAQRAAAIEAFRLEMDGALEAAGYPDAAAPDAINRPAVIALIAYFVILGAGLYAPLAALLVELFPARIRYTSLSFPYHVGSGWIGGFLPTTAFAIVAATGSIYSGLWYPVIALGLAMAICFFFLPETRGRPIDAA